MRKSALALIIVCTLGHFLTAARAEDCSEVDLSSELGPVRNQHDKGWCYANVSADLVGYRFRKELKGQQLSGAYLALLNNSLIRSNPYSNRGTMRMSARIGMTLGVCLMSLENDALTKGPKGTLNDKLQRIRELKFLFDQGQVEFLNYRLNQYANGKSILESIQRDDLNHILQHSTEKSFPIQLVTHLCKGHIWKPEKYVSMETAVQFYGYPIWDSWQQTRKKESLMSAIDRQLDENNIIGIGYYANFLTDPNARSEGGHASVVVGRKWNSITKKCEYKIRNSWGTQCGSYTEEFKETCKKNPGHIWVERNRLNSNLVSITFIKD